MINSVNLSLIYSQRLIAVKKDNSHQLCLCFHSGSVFSTDEGHLSYYLKLISYLFCFFKGWQCIYGVTTLMCLASV